MRKAREYKNMWKPSVTTEMQAVIDEQDENPSSTKMRTNDQARVRKKELGAWKVEMKKKATIWGKQAEKARRIY